MITKEEQILISYSINNQKGRNYPYSNQIIVCGFFGTDDTWKSFQKEEEERIDRKMFFGNIYPHCTIYCKEIEWLYKKKGGSRI